MIAKIKNKLYSSEIFQHLKQQALENKKLNLRGVAGSLRSLLVCFLFEELKRQILYIAPDDEEAEGIHGDLEILLGGEKVYFFPGDAFYSPPGWNPKPEILGQRTRTLEALLGTQAVVTVASVGALARKILSPQPLKSQRLQIKSGEAYNFEELLEHLIDLGYRKEDLVEEPGQISVRGGIVDVFPFERVNPLRIEFFGDQVESIREFDVITQRSKEEIEGAVFLPAKVEKDCTLGADSFREEKYSSLLDYLQKDAIIVHDEPELLSETVDEAISKAYAVRKRWHLHHGEDNLYEIGAAFLTAKELRAQIKALQGVLFYSIYPPSAGVIDFKSRSQESFGGNIRLLRQRIQELNKVVEVFILCDDRVQAERLEEILDTDGGSGYARHIGVGALRWGFHFPQASLSVFTEREIYGRSRRKKIWRTYRRGIPLRRLSALNIGDYVVHVDHGIGKYLGLEKIVVNQNERECLKILYQDGDKLYVPVEKLSRVQKYAGAEGAVPQLSKLGGRGWARIKARTKKSVKNIARDLIEIYAARKALKGYAFSPDSSWQKELEASFIYDETPDQLTATEDVKRDMESATPMERLICGDVGYGKTEVTVRASFKAVLDSKQVAILVPTTILAQQHYRTFKERLKNYPVNVAVLSRFRTPKEQKKIIEGLKEGKVDVVIGTHRLLSDDVGFKDLGLVIIDEEQRFGVRHKERLKKLKRLVDVLTLSATPIPRTLHLSLMGARDMSNIITPPQNRLPIITEIIPFDKDLIRKAVIQEIERGGQVYFVHNRVQSINAMLRMLKRLLPEVEFALAHGQMPERELERVMLEFLDKKYDCLVSTMIIESGLDIPNVNTIIVNRADRFGLAQLYQLRGRVGRSNRQAYAYLIIPPFQFLTESAMKRLKTIEEFTELGSGFQIALRDLEIRGAGNLLGSEQSGYINAVGFDLYCKILEEAVRELRGETTGEAAFEEEPVETQVEADVDAFLPEEYVGLSSERVDFYRRLARANSIEEIKSIREELRDRFGPVPESAHYLLNIATMRVLGSKLMLEKIEIRGKNMVAWFSPRVYKREKGKELLENIVSVIMEKIVFPFRFLQDKSFGFAVELTSSKRERMEEAQSVLLALHKYLKNKQ